VAYLYPAPCRISLANILALAVSKSNIERVGEKVSEQINDTRWAPIVLFTFKRPEHTRRTLESLAQNSEFLDSPLFVYCDGSRNEGEVDQVEETRRLVRDWPHPNKIIVERDKNWGLANSVIAGVSDLCKRFGRVIVVEDDLIVSPIFLNYMNTSLNRYMYEPKVMQISGHMFPVDIISKDDAVMLPVTTSWGWATWDRSWQYFDSTMSGYEKLRVDERLRCKFDLDGSYPYYRMLKHQSEGKVDSWAIRWYLSVFIEGGLVLFPRHSLVRHDGYDETATHATRQNQSIVKEVWTSQIINYPIVEPDQGAFSTVTSFFRQERSFFKRLKGVLGIE